MTLKRARALAYAIQSLHGLYTGFYINLYLVVVGTAGVGAALPIASHVIGSAFLVLLFVSEYPLELLGGAAADRYGPKRTFVASFILRAVFTLGLAALLSWSAQTMSAAPFLAVVAGLVLTFAVAFTLLSGNFEIWLRGLCDTPDSGTGAFTWSETLFWAGLTVGALTSILLPEDARSVSLIASTLCALIAAALCAFVQDHRRRTSEYAPHLWTLVAAAQPLLRRHLPDVDRVFIVMAIVYGLAQATEGLIPLYYVGQLALGDDNSQRVFVAILCLWLPALLGAISKTPSAAAALARFRSTAATPSATIRDLRSRTLWYAFWSALIPLTLLIPSSADASSPLDYAGTFVLGLVVFVARVLYGPLRPLFKSYAAGRIIEIAGTIAPDDRRRLGQAAVMSIGERRMKLGAIVVFAPLFFVELVSQESSSNAAPTWLWVTLAVGALLLACVSVRLLGAGRKEVGTNG